MIVIVFSIIMLSCMLRDKQMFLKSCSYTQNSCQNSLFFPLPFKGRMFKPQFTYLFPLFFHGISLQVLLVSQVLVWVDSDNVESKFVCLVTFPGLSCHSLTFKIQLKRGLAVFGEEQDVSILELWTLLLDWEKEVLYKCNETP